MSSDTYYAFCAPFSGHLLRLCVIPTPAGSVESCGFTRSFVLQALVDAAPTLAQRKTLFPFVAEGDWVHDAWMRKHVNEYVVSTVSAHDLNGVPVKGPDKGHQKTWKAIAKAREKSPGDLWGPIRDALHSVRHYWIDVVVTRPEIVAHLEPWRFWGTTAYDSWPTDAASKRSSLKGGGFGRASALFAAELPDYAYPPGLVAEVPAAPKPTPPAEAPAAPTTRLEKLRALIPGHRVKTVAKVLDLKPLNRANDLLLADILLATADPAKVDSKTAARLMAAANRPNKTKKDFLVEFAVGAD